MKKHHFIKMSSIALSLCVALGTFPATAFADDANATTITKAYVDKATYTPGRLQRFMLMLMARLERRRRISKSLI